MHPRRYEIFAYGSLLAGEGHHSLLDGAQFVRPATTEPTFDLIDLGGYPAMVRGGVTAVHGEVWAVDSAALARIDDLEGHPDYYQRQRVRLHDGSQVMAYVLPRGQLAGQPKITTGNWRNRGNQAG